MAQCQEEVRALGTKICFQCVRPMLKAMVKKPMEIFKNQDEADTYGVKVKVCIKPCNLRDVEVHRNLTLVQKPYDQGNHHRRCSAEALINLRRRHCGNKTAVKCLRYSSLSRFTPSFRSDFCCSAPRCLSIGRWRIYRSNIG